MAYYKSPEAMYAARERRFQESGDRYWALARSGEGDAYYSKARFCYGQAAENHRKAERARNTNATWQQGQGNY